MGETRGMILSSCRARLGWEMRAEEKGINSELNKLGIVEAKINDSLPSEYGPLGTELMKWFPNRDGGTYGTGHFTMPKLSCLTLEDFSRSMPLANVRTDLKEFLEHYMCLSRLTETE